VRRGSSHCVLVKTRVLCHMVSPLIYFVLAGVRDVIPVDLITIIRCLATERHNHDGSGSGAIVLSENIFSKPFPVNYHFLQCIFLLGQSDFGSCFLIMVYASLDSSLIQWDEKRIVPFPSHEWPDIRLLIEFLAIVISELLVFVVSIVVKRIETSLKEGQAILSINQSEATLFKNSLIVFPLASGGGDWAQISAMLIFVLMMPRKLSSFWTNSSKIASTGSSV